MSARAVVVAALLACAPTVHAAGGEGLPEAREHYDRGMAHYELGEFGAAVEEFKAAYARSQAPGLLFNLAQASRLNKDYEQALHFYRTYLRVRPDAPNRDDVERRIAELEPIVQAQRKAELQKQLVVERATPTARPVTPPPSPLVDRPVAVARPHGPSGKSLRLAGIGVAVGGVGLLGAGVGLGVGALDAQSKLSRLASDMGSWTPDQASLYQTGQRDAAIATAMYAVGGAAVATGVVLYVIGWQKDRKTRFAAAPVAGGGASAMWSCEF